MTIFRPAMAAVSGLAALMAATGAGAVSGVNCAGNVVTLDGTEPTTCNTFPGATIATDQNGAFASVNEATGEIKLFAASDEIPIPLALTFGQVVSALTSEVITLSNSDTVNPQTVQFSMNVNGSIAGNIDGSSTVSAGIAVDTDLSAQSFNAGTAFGAATFYLSEPALTPFSITSSDPANVTVPEAGDPGLAAGGFDFDVLFGYELAPGETVDLKLTYGMSLILSLLDEGSLFEPMPAEGFAVADLDDTLTAAILAPSSVSVETESFGNVQQAPDAAIPLPASAWLLAGALGLLGAARRTRHG